MNTRRSISRGNLLVVDDAPANLELLGSMLKKQGFKVRLAPGGELGLLAAREERPDLILLDINMPGMNGYEVCDRLKADPDLKQVPVIFISALDDVMDKVKAFQVGGVDYVTKPFHFEEVMARVGCHLQLRRQEHQLQENFDRLKALEGLRDNLVHMIVHDMRAHLSVTLMALEMAHHDQNMNPEALAKWLQNATMAATTLKEMITQLLDISRLEEGRMPINLEQCNVSEILQAAIVSVTPLVLQRTVRVSDPAPVFARCDRSIVARIVGNLLANAIKYTANNGRITLSATPEDGQIRIEISDDGYGIAPECHAVIFEKFGQVGLREKRVGTGLGLTFCKLAVEAHGGRIGVRSQIDQGSTFWFTLPAAP